MTDLDKMRLRAQLMAVQSARTQHELTIMERLDEINRVKEQIDIQLKKEEELKLKLKENN
jgi:hypothetical protein